MEALSILDIISKRSGFLLNTIKKNNKESMWTGESEFDRLCEYRREVHNDETQKHVQ